MTARIQEAAGARHAEAATRSPVPAILVSLLAGAALAVIFLLGAISSGSEPRITGGTLVAFGVGWALMALLSARFSSQPQPWMAVPAAVLGLVGLGLVVLQPGPAAMDALSWVWPPTLAALAIWMAVHVRRQLRGRGQWLVAPLVGSLLLFAVGGAFATVGGAGGRATSGSGELIAVNGHRLYLECIGHGFPVVVLEAGLLMSSSSWSQIAPSVAETTTVCAYDRAGHGRSDEATGPQDGRAIAGDLRTLLERAGVPGPYVLVGHSSGGAYVRVFAARYPDQVAGMVLLDSQPADAFTALPDYPAFYESLRLAGALSPSIARVGLLGLLLGTPADQSTVANARSGRDEVRALPTALRQAQELTTLGSRPLVVVSAGSGNQAGWAAAQERLASLSSASVHRVIEGATHDSLVSGADAGASSRAIVDVVAAVRAGTPPR